MVNILLLALDAAVARLETIEEHVAWIFSAFANLSPIRTVGILVDTARFDAVVDHESEILCALVVLGPVSTTCMFIHARPNDG